jgi:hypothetical protein
MDRTFIACDRQSTVSLPKAVIQLNVSSGQPQWKRSKQNRNHHHDAWTGLLSTGSRTVAAVLVSWPSPTFFYLSFLHVVIDERVIPGQQFLTKKGTIALLFGAQCCRESASRLYESWTERPFNLKMPLVWRKLRSHPYLWLLLLPE